MSAPLVRLVVLNYNGGEFVLKCLEHLEALDHPRDRLDLVVVDNASVDGSDREIERRFPSVRLLRTGENLGFPANNLGLADLDGVDYVGLINNDAFVEPGYLAPLIATLESDPGIGAACPKMVLAPRFVSLPLESQTFTVTGDSRQLGVRVSGIRVDGEDRFADAALGDGFWGIEAGPVPESRFAWTSAKAIVGVPFDAATIGAAIPPTEISIRMACDHAAKVRLGRGEAVDVDTTPRWFAATVEGEAHDIVQNAGSILVAGGWGADRGFLEVDRGQYEEAMDVVFWCGAGVLFRPDYLADVGLLDERFFMYYEDTDMGWRGRLRGWRYRYTPEARLRHMHAATSGEGSPMFQHFVERNRLAMLTKNAPTGLLVGAVGRYARATASYARRDIVGRMIHGDRPDLGLVSRRTRSFLAWAKMLPPLLRDRRRVRGRQTVPDGIVTGWAVEQ